MEPLGDSSGGLRGDAPVLEEARVADMKSKDPCELQSILMITGEISRTDMGFYKNILL